MGVDFYASSVLGFEMTVRDCVVELPSACHGQTTGKFCVTCGKELRPGYGPTDLIRRVAAEAGVDADELYWSHQDPCVVVLSYGYAPREWKWDDTVVVGWGMGSTGSHRSGCFPCSDVGIDFVRNITDSLLESRKRWGIPNGRPLRLFTIGTVSA